MVVVEKVVAMAAEAMAAAADADKEHVRRALRAEKRRHRRER